MLFTYCILFIFIMYGTTKMLSLNRVNIEALLGLFCQLKTLIYNKYMNVVIRPEFSKFPKKIKVRSLSLSRCKLSVSVDFVSLEER